MNKCKHKHKCFQCVQEEIKELEIKLQELKKLLPSSATTMSGNISLWNGGSSGSVVLC